MSDDRDNVRAFPLQIVPPSRLDPMAPDDSVVVFCEKLLDRARSGELRAVAVATLHRDDGPADGWAAALDASMHSLMGAITYLQVRMAHGVNSNDRAGWPDKG